MRLHLIKYLITQQNTIFYDEAVATDAPFPHNGGGVEFILCFHVEARPPLLPWLSDLTHQYSGLDGLLTPYSLGTCATINEKSLHTKTPRL